MTTFGREKRIRSGNDFRTIYDAGCRAGDDVLLVFAARNDAGVTRLGVSVSKKHGSAVVRNRRKRLLREAFRLSYHRLPESVDLVIVPRIQSEPSLKEYFDSMIKLAGILQKRLNRHSGGGNVRPGTPS
ncbi:MAG: ribonuclease P protein component [Planctomyces sp.]|nr:ribonuclease P protein component [Planctomyces sp.]